MKKNWSQHKLEWWNSETDIYIILGQRIHHLQQLMSIHGVLWFQHYSIFKIQVFVRLRIHIHIYITCIYNVYVCDALRTINYFIIQINKMYDCLWCKRIFKSPILRVKKFPNKVSKLKVFYYLFRFFTFKLVLLLCNLYCTGDYRTDRKVGLLKWRRPSGQEWTTWKD